MAKLYPKNDAPASLELAKGSRKAEAPSQRKTLGVVGFVKGMLLGQTSPEISEARLAICRACTATDSKGERLFREIAGKMYCGVPRLEQLLRDEDQSGCGCNLNLKVSRRYAACPLGKWKA